MLVLLIRCPSVKHKAKQPQTGSGLGYNRSVCVGLCHPWPRVWPCISVLQPSSNLVVLRWWNLSGRGFGFRCRFWNTMVLLEPWLVPDTVVVLRKQVCPLRLPDCLPLLLYDSSLLCEFLHWCYLPHYNVARSSHPHPQLSSCWHHDLQWLELS